MTGWITDIMQGLGYIGIAMLMLLENIFPPIPSEVVMPLAGLTAARGELTLVGVIAAGTVGSVLGALAWYWIGRICGAERIERWVERHGAWIGIAPHDLERAMGWFSRHGYSAVVIGRLIPGVRTLVSIPAGLGRMPLLPFLSYTALGTAAWTGMLAYAGGLLGENWQAVGDYVGPIGTAIVVAAVLYLLLRFIRGQAHGRS